MDLVQEKKMRQLCSIYKYFWKNFLFINIYIPKKENLIKQIKIDFLISPLIGKIKLRLKKFEILRDRIQLIKIDTNGSEKDIINSLIRLIKRINQF